MFAYCRNNPVCRKDVSGRDDVECTDLDNNEFTDDEDYFGAGGTSTDAPVETSTSSSGGGNSNPGTPGNGLVNGGNVGPPVGQNNGASAPSAQSHEFTPDQQAVIQLAKASKSVGLTMAEAEILVGWAKEYGISCHEPTMHESRYGVWSQTMHINIRNIHIRVY
jgi:hypothetical protein